MDVPDVVVRWVIVNSTISNVELARLSNVCRNWRDTVTTTLFDAVVADVDGGRQRGEKGGGEGTPRKNNDVVGPSSTLLLPSMARRLLRLPSVDPPPREPKPQQIVSPLVPASCPPRRLLLQPRDNDTFCAAWFHPGGIQTLKLEGEKPKKCEEVTFQRNGVAVVSPEQQRQQKKQEEGQQQRRIIPQQQPLLQQLQPSPERFTPNGGPSYEGSGHRRNYRVAASAQRPPTISPNNNCDNLPQHHLTCSNEWRGYRDPMDVLEPFGYHESFVRRFLDLVSNYKADRLEKKSVPDSPSFIGGSPDVCHNNNNTGRSSGIKPNVDHDVLNIQQQQQRGETKHHYQTTFAVRGATIARPEGYCLCWEEEEDESSSERVISSAALNNNNNNNNNTTTEETTTETMTSTTTEDRTAKTTTASCRGTNGWGNNRADILRQEHQQCLLRRKKACLELQRTMLPRVLKCPLNKNGTSSSSSKDDDSPRRQQQQQQQQCVQFLNSDRSHAVRLLTPPFACGPLPEPVTIFLVGIATEDGCFLSGLRHRFEVGHMYPNDSVSSVSELSPVCIATNPSFVSYSGSPGGADSRHSSSHDGTSAKKGESESLFSNNINSNNNDNRSGVGSNSIGDAFSRSAASFGGFDDDDSSFFDSSDGSSVGIIGRQANGFLRSSCSCVFHEIESMMMRSNSNDRDDINVDSSNDDSGDDNDEGPPERIYRGTRGPGLWHCYTVVFDGSNSVIRMDGVQELPLPVEQKEKTKKPSFSHREEELEKKEEEEEEKGTNKLTENNGGYNKNSDGYFNSTSSNNSLFWHRRLQQTLHYSKANHHTTATQDQQRPAAAAAVVAALDGLTLGSDHCFDESLCFGQSSVGEGEGAISEVAVFKGRFDVADLEALERRLMAKHGIPVPRRSQETLAREDRWDRRAHALFSQPLCNHVIHQHHENHHRDDITTGEKEGGDDYSRGCDGIPLRFMTRNRAVSWHCVNAVTGKKLRIKKIGTRCYNGQSSSDW